MDTTRANAPATSRDHLLVALVIALGLGALCAMVNIAQWPAVHAGFTLGLPALCVMFAIAELAVVHVPVREDEHTISFSEIPLVAALFYATPLATVIAQPLGTLAVLVFRHRQRGTKLAFNVVQTTWQPLIAVLVFHALVNATPSDPFYEAVAALVAVCVADIASALLVTMALALHQGTGSLESAGFAIVTGAAGAACKGALGILAVVAVDVHGVTALFPVALVVIPMWVSFYAYGRVHARLERAELLYQFTQAIDGSISRIALDTAIATQAAIILLSLIHI